MEIKITCDSIVPISEWGTDINQYVRQIDILTNYVMAIKLNRHIALVSLTLSEIEFLYSNISYN